LLASTTINTKSILKTQAQEPAPLWLLLPLNQCTWYPFVMFSIAKEYQMPDFREDAIYGIDRHRKHTQLRQSLA
jgi:hypothetical protein